MHVYVFMYISFLGRNMIFPILNIRITTICITLPKQFAGAEIFAKRRKRSEKWVVDQEQPQTPNTPVTPKTPTEKLVSHTKLSLRTHINFNPFYIHDIIISYCYHDCQLNLTVFPQNVQNKKIK